MNYALFDIHSHVHDKAFNDDREKVLEEMKSYGVGTITIGTDCKESEASVALSEKYAHVYASVGLHPNDNKEELFDEKKYEELALHEKVVAIGECGLDYFRLEEVKDVVIDEEKARQKGIFIQQIELAVKVNKPLMLHGRPSKGTMDAYEDMLTILEESKKKYGNKLRGNAHFFAGNIDIAQRFINIGFTMSFSGVITFTKEFDDVVRFIPLTLLHAETDSPYATPVPYRGKRNTPMYVQEVVAKIAVIREQPMEEVRVQLLENARRVFGI
ncbi:MAG: TatD family hydrolase [Candidatus Pacebacteria bacterium]|nr:TatD family hydrolase [Candidatus Paceibacterota bacterium]MBP9866787.1 TatD family hydrolase [Candidatus Paceibacterota bacterium]